MARVAVRLIIRGRVQGVGYRWWTREEARRLQLDGWVRNLRDGSVEVLAIGAPAAIDRLVQACWRGPAAADVDSIERYEAADDGAAAFDARPTL